MEVLLATDLVTLEDHYEPKKEVFQGKDISRFNYEEEHEMLHASFSGIDFEMAYQIEVE